MSGFLPDCHERRQFLDYIFPTFASFRHAWFLHLSPNTIDALTRSPFTNIFPLSQLALALPIRTIHLHGPETPISLLHQVLHSNPQTNTDTTKYIKTTAFPLCAKSSRITISTSNVRSLASTLSARQWMERAQRRVLAAHTSDT